MPQSILSFFCIAVFFGSLHGGTAAAASKPAITIHVASDGNDAWSGSLAKPNRARSDGPLATPERARQKIRELKQAGPLPRGGVTVVLRGGTYFLTKTFQLGAEDSGTADAPVVYRGADGEKVQVIGGRAITGFDSYQGSIVKANVGAQGFKGVHFRQLFFNSKRQHLARYPNFDPQNPYGGGWSYVEGKQVDIYQNIPGESRRILTYQEKDARTWSRPEEAEVFIFARFNWWNDILQIATVDRQQRTITLAGNASYAIRGGDRYYVQNALEELDAPGEWYLDRRSETLYFWPPASLENKTVYAPTLRTLIEMGPGTSNVTIRGLTLECCEGDAVVLDQASECLVAGNTIRNVGDYRGSGVIVRGGRNNGVAGNDIYEVGRHAIWLSGGDRVKLTPAGNYADNNYIHHTGVFYKEGVGVMLDGVGNRAIHNLIHDGPRFGIRFSGNNLVIEYNHIRHVCLETEDTGAIYTGGRDWISSRGSRVCYNYFHDVYGYGQRDGKWISPYFARGIYLDDNAGGVDVIGNIVARVAASPMMLHNGRDNLIENNVFADGMEQQVHYLGWVASKSGSFSHLREMIRGYESVVDQPAWREMRGMKTAPEKAVLPDGTIMSGNVLRRNIYYYRKPNAGLYRFQNVSLAHNQSDYNLAYHFGQPLEIEASQSGRRGDRGAAAKAPPHDKPTDQWPQWWQAAGEDKHSVVADPLFVNAEKDDYRLRPESPALKLGFKPIPVDKIGPYRDPLRASWPIVEAEGARERPLMSER